MNLKNMKFAPVRLNGNRFVCALCHSERSMKFKRNISIKNYAQMALLFAAISYFAYPYIGPKIIYINLVAWTLAEAVNKLLYRKELPCKVCGFDALWYRRDVKVARRKVEDFIKATSAGKVTPIEVLEEQIVQENTQL